MCKGTEILKISIGVVILFDVFVFMSLKFFRKWIG